MAIRRTPGAGRAPIRAIRRPEVDGGGSNLGNYSRAIFLCLWYNIFRSFAEFPRCTEQAYGVKMAA
jgi:hypothetical protein